MEKFKEFFMSSWAIDNRVTTFVLTGIVVLLGIVSFNSLPKENFPEIAIPTIYIGTPYPGNTPENIEKNITYHIEKELKSIEGVKKIKSQSIQDFSVVIVEFETNVNIDDAKDDVQEAVDNSKSNLPQDLPSDPIVQDIDLSQVPIMFINISADLSADLLKEYSEDLQDKIEQLSEIRRVDLLGVQEKEVQVDIDLVKMQSRGFSMGDVATAIQNRDVLISGGSVTIGKKDYSIQVNGKFNTVEQIRNVVIRNNRGASVDLKDIADVNLAFKDVDSYSRLDGTPTISLSVIKKAGENLVDASDKIKAIVEEFKTKDIPVDLRDAFSFKISADQSYLTKNMLSDLSNTIIIGFILVTLVLMFFMGLQDSTFVGLSVPLSSMIAFIVLPWLGFTLNLVVLFTFIFALGIVVDNAIVVIENTYRILNSEDGGIVRAAKKAAGEVIVPVFAGTLTTMAPFLPLAFWEGIVGEFMFFLPVTIIIILLASLLVAYVINPVFATAFMRKNEEKRGTSIKGFLAILGVVLLFSLLSFLAGNGTGANIFLILGILMVLFRFVLDPGIKIFQRKVIPWMVASYKKLLTWSMRKWHPYAVVIGTVFVLFFSFGFFGANPPKTVFFPEADPNFMYIYTQLAVGTEIETTNEITLEIEKIVNEAIGDDKKIVKSTIANVAKGAGSPQDFNQNSIYPNKSRIQVEFIPFKEREGISSSDILTRVRKRLREAKRNNPKVPGDAVMVVEKEPSGPPTAKPVNIEVRSEKFEKVQIASASLFSYLRARIDSGIIEGVEELKTDLEIGKPEISFDLDENRTSDLGMNHRQVGFDLRNAVFGREISQFRPLEDEYPIMIRLAKPYREDIDQLKEVLINYRDMSTGNFHAVPISAIASVNRGESLGAINRLDLEKAITISSNVLVDANPNEVVADVIDWMEQWKAENPRLLDGVTVEMTGQVVEQAETSAFLGGALGASMILIFLILIFQFNSLSKVAIIFSQIIFSITGVLLGFALSGQDMSIVMVGVGIVALAGLVVNNGIILLDFIQMKQDEGLPLKQAIIEGGSTRFTPVILTASSTVLGLFPLSVGLNVNFETLFTSFDPQIFTGGDTAIFWGSLSWTIIYGLGFATIVTLVVVPVMYYLFMRGGERIGSWRRSLSSRLSDFISK